MDFGMFGWWVVVGVLAGWLTGFVMKDGGYARAGGYSRRCSPPSSGRSS